MWQGAVESDLFAISHEAGLRELENAFRRCEERAGRPATNLEVCEELGITLAEFYRLLERYRGLSLGRFEEIASADAEDGGGLVKYVPHAHDDEIYYLYSKSELRDALSRAFDALPKNEQLVVSLLYHHRLKTAEIAGIVGFSEARVAQIHTTAMLRMRPKLLALDPGRSPQPLASAHAAPAV